MSPSAQCLQYEVVGVERGEHDHLRRARQRQHPPGGFDPIDAGHADVHEDDVWLLLLHQRYGAVAVGGFSDDLERRRTAAEHHA